MPPTYEYVEMQRMLPCGVKSKMGCKLPSPMENAQAKQWVKAKFGSQRWEFAGCSTVDVRMGKI